METESALGAGPRAAAAAPRYFASNEWPRGSFHSRVQCFTLLQLCPSHRDTHRAAFFKLFDGGANSPQITFCTSCVDEVYPFKNHQPISSVHSEVYPVAVGVHGAGEEASEDKETSAEVLNIRLREATNLQIWKAF